MFTAFRFYLFQNSFPLVLSSLTHQHLEVCIRDQMLGNCLQMPFCYWFLLCSENIHCAVSGILNSWSFAGQVAISYVLKSVGSGYWLGCPTNMSRTELVGESFIPYASLLIFCPRFINHGRWLLELPGVFNF